MPALVAAYGFEDGTGTTTADNSGAGCRHPQRCGLGSAGKYGKALSFNGTSNWVTVADAAPLHLTSAMTLEAWVYPTAAPHQLATAVLKERGTNGWRTPCTPPTGRPGRRPGTSTSRDRLPRRRAAALALNTWAHLAATYDGTTLRLYVNGAQAATKSLSGTITQSTAPLRMGGNSVWGEYFKGLIDEVRVYSTALTVPRSPPTWPPRW